MLDRKVIIFNTLIVLRQLLFTYLIYVWIVHILQVEINLSLLFLVVTVQRLSSLVRLLPGDLGLGEVRLLIAAIARTAQICILPCGIIPEKTPVNNSYSEIRFSV